MFVAVAKFLLWQRCWQRRKVSAFIPLPQHLYYCPFVRKVRYLSFALALYCGDYDL